MEAAPQSKARHVVIVGAGVSGLALAQRLARRWSRDQNDEGGTKPNEDDPTTAICGGSFADDYPSTSSVALKAISTVENPEKFQANDEKSECKSRHTVKRLLEITILEANEFVGGRVRTIKTGSTTVSCPAHSSTPSFLSFSPSNSEEYRRRYQKFYPWIIPLGAEFVHGDDGNTALVDDIIYRMQRGNWRQSSGQSDVGNSRNDDNDDDDDNDWNKHNFNDMSQDISVWHMDLVLDYGMKTPNLMIFADGRCFHWCDGKEEKFASCDNESNADKDDDNAINSSKGWQRCIQSAKHIWDDILDLEHDDSAKDMTLEEYVIGHNHFIKEGYGKSVDCQQTLAILDAVYATTAGTTARKMGINEASRQEKKWSYGDRNYRLGGCFSELVDYYLAELDVYNSQMHSKQSCEARVVSVDIITNCQVTEIETKNAKICIGSSNDQIFDCDRVAVTVPLAVLKANFFKFNGHSELSTEINRGIQTINVMSGGKVHALLKWGVDLVSWDQLSCSNITLKERLSGIYVCPQDDIFSQIWFRWKKGHSILATGFYVYDECDNATVLNGFGKNGKRNSSSLENKFKTIVEKILCNRLGKFIFPKKDREDATAFTFSAFDVYDWSDDMHIRGLYASPSVNLLNHRRGETPMDSGSQCYHHLATLSNRIFFAGEHIHTETNATVQSAIESGICAADDILVSLMSCKVKSKLI